MNRNLARAVLLTAGLIWATGFLVNKYVLDSGWDDSQLLFVRFASATFFLFLLFGKRILNAFKVTGKTGMYLGVFMFLGFFFQTLGLVYTTPSKNALITAGYIVFLPIIVFLAERRKTHIKTLIAAFLTFVGIGLISMDTSNISNINMGDVYTFIGAIFWGVHIYLLGKETKRHDPISLMGFQLITVTILSLGSMFLRSEFPPLDWNQPTTIRLWLVALLIGFFASFVAFLLQSIGQKHSNETEAAILISTESFFGPILAILFYHDPLDWSIGIGMVLVFLGVLLSEIDITQILNKAPLLRKKRS